MKHGVLSVSSKDEMMQKIAKSQSVIPTMYSELMAGRMKIGERMAKIEGLPDDPEERADCVSLFIATVILQKDGKVTLPVDWMIEAKDVVRLIATIYTFKELGFITLREDITDRYGFSAIELHEDQIRTMQEVMRNGHEEDAPRSDGQ